MRPYQSLEAISQIDSTFSDDLRQCTGAAGRLVGIEQNSLALMDDKIELSVVETELPPQHPQFIGNRNSLATNGIIALDQAFGRDIAGAALAVNAEYPAARREAVGLTFGNEPLHHEVRPREQLWRNLRQRCMDPIALEGPRSREGNGLACAF